MEWPKLSKHDHIATWRFDLDHHDPVITYLLTMYDTRTTDSRGQARIAYKLTEKRPGRSMVLFMGVDFSGSPMHADDSLETARALMGFLTLRPGDTDPDYFKDYTPTQLRFTETYAEELSAMLECDACFERIYPR